ncbi:HPF/RaiA family ribosome-associated protein [Novilysobacter spongiicola]|uniref:Sigma 54 modulation protein / S30EA ribosomal protein n=1 Tax=Lysobacter spongiicola DSM 21749 TaxID=1122188 RepID=A0A1T4LJY8_9GAMM|nr:HPF/RaiA family ribosome-associated protein [Lysobacter spongiicola]SJZ54936.1 Sigma 54 modulation protein / S30EA ribosomal protein [Lysobacter spongiicola DSM 21749]
MKVQLNTDKNVQADESLVNHAQEALETALGRFGDQILRVEVHVSDVNGGKSGDNDKHCTMEARVENRPPVVASHDADTVRAAVTGAARKLQRVLDSSFGKLGA